VAARRKTKAKRKAKKKTTGSESKPPKRKRSNGRYRPPLVEGLSRLKGDQLVSSLNVLNRRQITELLTRIGYSMPEANRQPRAGISTSKDQVCEAIRKETRKLLQTPDGRSFLKAEIEEVFRDFTTCDGGFAVAKRQALEREVQRWIRSPRGAMQLHRLRAEVTAEGLLQEPGSLAAWILKWFEERTGDSGGS